VLKDRLDGFRDLSPISSYKRCISRSNSSTFWGTFASLLLAYAFILYCRLLRPGVKESRTPLHSSSSGVLRQSAHVLPCPISLIDCNKRCDNCTSSCLVAFFRNNPMPCDTPPAVRITLPLSQSFPDHHFYSKLI
jgi:hypothetical protein